MDEYAIMLLVVWSLRRLRKADLVFEMGEISDIIEVEVETYR